MFNTAVEARSRRLAPCLWFPLPQQPPRLRCISTSMYRCSYDESMWVIGWLAHPVSVCTAAVVLHASQQQRPIPPRGRGRNYRYVAPHVPMRHAKGHAAARVCKHDLVEQRGARDAARARDGAGRASGRAGMHSPRSALDPLLGAIPAPPAWPRPGGTAATALCAALRAFFGAEHRVCVFGGCVGARGTVPASPHGEVTSEVTSLVRSLTQQHQQPWRAGPQVAPLSLPN